MMLLLIIYNAMYIPHLEGSFSGLTLWYYDNTQGVVHKRKYCWLDLWFTPREELNEYPCL